MKNHYSQLCKVYLRRSLLARMAALLAVAPLVGPGQTSDGAASLNSILQPTAAVKDGGTVEIRFVNLGQKEIMGFRYSRATLYADGKEVKTPLAGGADFVGAAAERAALKSSGMDGQRLLPGQAFSMTVPLPASPDGSKAVKVDVTISALSFADRTAVGDPKVIKLILSSRRQDLGRVEAAIAEAQSLMAEPDPRSAVAARVATFRESGKLPSGAGFIRLLNNVLSTRGPAAAQQLIAGWERRRQALAEHSTLKGNN